jgi:hypothetical protein
VEVQDMDSLQALQTVVLVVEQVITLTPGELLELVFSQQAQAVVLETLVASGSQTLGTAAAAAVVVPLEETFRQALELEVVELDIQAQLQEPQPVMQVVEVDPLGKETHQIFLVLVERAVEQMEV